MKILAIRIRNLASIDGFTEIDFTTEPLCSAGIFAITGVTGAGKSTILDALCLALYAQTPRYKNAEARIELRDVGNNKLAQNDVRGILRDGTGEGFAEVDFVGVDNKKYRAQWAVKRARGKINGAIQTETITLKSLDTGQVICSKKTEACKEIERLVGLNYEQFTRSILLAQGDFTAFLKADKDAKASLLEKLTGTDIYSKISQRIYENYKSAQGEVAGLKAQLDNVELLTEEEISVLKSDSEGLGTNIHGLEAECNKVNAQLAWHEQRELLNNQQSILKSKLDTARETLASATPQIEQLFLVEQVQQIKPTFDKLQSTSEQLAENNLLLEKTTGAQAEKTLALESLQLQASEQGKKLESARKDKLAASPLLVEATRLDLVLQEKEKQVRIAIEDVSEAQLARNKVHAESEEKTNSIATLTSLVSTLEEWEAKHSDRKLIAENYALIHSKLEDAAKLLNQSGAKKIELELEEQRLAAACEHLSALQAKEDSSKQLLRELQDAVIESRGKLTPGLMQQLEDKRKTCDEIVSDLVHASATWSLLFAELNARDLYEQQSRELGQAVEMRRLELESIGKKLPALMQKKAESVRRLEKTKLELAKDVATLRQFLAEGESCPVCGSTDHPYAKHFPTFENTLTILEEEAAVNEMAVQELLNKQYSASTFLETNIPLINELQRKFATSCDKIVTLESRWKGYAVYQHCGSVTKAEMENWLQEYSERQKAEQAVILKDIHAFNDQKKLLEEQSSRLTLLESEQATDRHARTIAESEIKAARLQVQSIISQREELVSALNSITNKLNAFFPNPQWKEKWHQEPLVFLKQIEKFQHDWNQNIAKLDSNRSMLTVMRSELQHIEKQLLQCETELKKKKNTLLDLQRNVEELKQQRLLIFGGKPVIEVEATLENTIDLFEQDFTRLSQEVNDLRIELSLLNTHYEQLSASILKDQSTRQKHTDDINQWLRAFNQQHERSLSIESLPQFFSYNHQWIQRERALIQKWNEDLLQAETSWRDLADRMQEHERNRNSDFSRENLKLTATELSGQVDIQKRELNHIEFRLKQDAENQKKAGRFMKQVREYSDIAENWGRLNDMIGSADGKKFRQVAQEYTLEVLLAFANVHLSQLSRRYHLQRIEETLGLQVIDHDMGDEIRSVYSLSGGESFLVSLALALGLASLSSNNIKVESLFIDEGFGSLDPATLNIVMDALERLHNQGRKVGVISHVQEMKERIMTQIKVTKQSSGKSIITIGNGLD